MIQPELSLVIPAYNEERRLGPTLQRVLPYLASRNQSFEVLVVDDGSSDGTVALAASFAPRWPVRVLKNGRNRGKGYAVKRGMLEARGRYAVFADADLSTPVEELERFLPHLAAGCDVVIGSRKMQGARIHHRQPLHRELMGRVFTFLVRLLVVGGISDITCGFKAFRQAAARGIFCRLRLEDWSFDAELLFLTRRLGLRLQEVPVSWSDAPATKVRLLRDTLSSLRGLLRIRLNAWLGRYR